MNRVVIVANRLPVTARIEGDELIVDPSSGGLATGLRGPHEQSEGLWIGWPGELPRLNAGQQRALDARLDELRTVPVYLTRREVKSFYEDVANAVLWPVFHDHLDQLPTHLGGWEEFRAVNARFARAAAERHEPGDLTWVHDYQLVLAPAMLRALVPDARIGFFLHIPFPSDGLLDVLPWREELLRGMLGADLIGFHTFSYLRHFCDALRGVLGVDAELDGVFYEGRRVRFDVYPMGVDAADWAARGRDPCVLAEAERINADASETRLIVGIDRLDYTKGLLRRLLAFQLFLERSPELRESVRFIQVTVPSREKVEAYAGLRRRIDELVGRINSTYATATSEPIHRLHTTLSPIEISALYRAADVMLVTPLRDGMNLVAKEFVATRTDDDGVLILSKFAGAASELGHALIVNPYDVDEVAGALTSALTMPREERRHRMQSLRQRVEAYDVHRWSASFLQDLHDHARASTLTTPAADARPTLTRLVERMREGRRFLLILDYDGTLVPFADTPELAAPDPDLLTLLRRLAGRPETRLHLVSGRSRQTLDSWFGALPIGLHAEHGCASRLAPGSDWIEAPTLARDWMLRLRPILDHFVAMTPGTFVEEKPTSLAWHYRRAANDPLTRSFVESQARELRLLIERMSASLPVEMLPGHMVVEARTRGVSKRNIVPRVLHDASGDEVVVALGDDRTDEELFAALPDGSLTVHVGDDPTRALYRLPDPASARQLLASLLD
jgi:trehalose 6-phosphate synthase/phosphatase